MVHKDKFYEVVKQKYPQYDYSKSKFTRLKDPITVICPKHGEFTKRFAFELYNGRSGCPLCGKEALSIKSKLNAKERLEKAKKTCQAKYGVDNPFQAEEIKEKIKQVNEERHGGIGRGSEEISKKIAKTKEEKYGDPNFTNREKCNETVKLKYGVDNISQLDFVKQKKVETTRKQFGVDYTFQSEECREKMRQTNLEVYGCENPAQNEEVRQKMYKTLWENGGLHRLEKRCYDKLLEKYPDAVREYKSDKYPFKCDFYIPSEDLYIELNIYWSHGGHYFNENDPQDIKLLEYWKSKNNETYEYAIHVWTEIDLKKKRCAEDNELNYLVFWTEEDFIEWLK